MAVAARNVILHLGHEHKTFMRGEEVPDEWAESVQAEGVLVDALSDEPEVPAPVVDVSGFERLATMEEVTDWVYSSADDSEIKARAAYALGQEEAKNAPRSTLISALRDIAEEG